MAKKKKKSGQAKSQQKQMIDTLMADNSLKDPVPSDKNCARVGLDEDSRTYAGSDGERLPLTKKMSDANPDPSPIDRAAYRDITHARLADKMDMIVTDPHWGARTPGSGR